eukprot:83864-Rhodomonas_salina.1
MRAAAVVVHEGAVPVTEDWPVATFELALRTHVTELAVFLDWSSPDQRLLPQLCMGKGAELVDLPRVRVDKHRFVATEHATWCQVVPGHSTRDGYLPTTPPQTSCGSRRRRLR